MYFLLKMVIFHCYVSFSRGYFIAVGYFSQIFSHFSLRIAALPEMVWEMRSTWEPQLFWLGPVHVGCYLEDHPMIVSAYSPGN